MSDIPAAVIGVGRMGQHHARNYSVIPGFKLAAVVDQSEAARTAAVEKYGCRAFGSVEEMLGANLGVKAASVAVPTIFHRGVAEKLLPAGIDLLIEKPLAPSVADARAIVDLAAARHCVLQVGHTERFNPAYVALEKYALQPKFIEVHRISPMTFRSVDIGVVLDMMIHDLDLVHHLVRSEVSDVRAVGVAVLAQHEDVCNARVTFANGCVANLTASRLALRSERRMRIFSPTAYASVDYQKKTGSVITKTANEKELEHVRREIKEGRITELTQLNYAELVKYEDLKVVDVEPVRAELEDFLRAIQTRSAPRVTGADGLAAVDMAARITASIAHHKWDGVTGF